MTPTPQDLAAAQPQSETVAEVLPAPSLDSDGERVVISGMSGLYPSSHHVKDLSDILYNKINPVATNRVRWTVNHPEAAQHMGTIPDLERFDAQFFRVHYRLGNSMDPMSRKVLEQAYNAIYDAGVNPAHLSGKKIGVFVGTCFSEAEKASFYDADSRSGLGITGCCKSMFANRISYWLNAKGPSMAIDESCCSSSAALEQAYLAMSRGECEAAVVGGCYLCLHPQSSVHYGRIISQAMDGKTKSFDQNADGCVKSEAVNVLFLQKAKDALRIYADLLLAKTEYTGLLTGKTGPLYGYFRDSDKTADFLNRFYEEARVPPHAVEYIEAFGSGVPDADKAELDALEKVFCKGKEDPLLVGSVISNIGYGEAASGITAIVKVLLGYHSGVIAANLHCNTPRQDVEALREGRMRVVTEHQPFHRSYVAVNGMSVTGVNSHVLLHGHYIPKDISRYTSSIAHLVTISARQDTTVTKIFDNLKSRPIDPEELALLHNIHQTSIPGHLGRGFIILGTNEEQKTVSLCEKAEYFDDARRPLWFVYSGMGSQWAGMGAQLMRIPIFAAAIERCRKSLEPKGIDIVHIITSPDKTIFDNILHSFVGIAAIQIGLTDVLKELGLVPDGIIGHSVGELGCAYADGCLTAEEMILSAYSRGLVSLQTPFIRGSMAAIGLGYEQIIKMCPPEIEVACHNGPESSTISGPADIMKEFVAELTTKGIFAKEVPCSNIAYHSRYIADAGPGLLKYLSEVIKTPRARSERWVSTSVPFDNWESPLAKYSSAEYHTNNLLNPVLFEETLKHIPTNAVLVEVAPHGLLQAILKRSLPGTCRNIALTRRGHADNTFLLLEAIGKLFMEGYNPKVQVLYPKVQTPVSTETPFLSHLVEWAHGEKWALPLYHTASRRKGAACTYTISLHDKEHQHLNGHVIREQIVFPFAATLVLVWDTLAMTMGVPKKQLSVEFRDVHLYSQPAMHTQSQLKLRAALQRGTGYFEVYDDKIKVATGNIIALKPDIKKDGLQLKETQDMNLTAEDVYDLLRERDYYYSGEFRSIEAASSSLNEASLVWLDNWVTFIDGLLQLNMLRQPHDGVTLPTHIRRIVVDVDKHLKLQTVTDGKVLYKAELLEEHEFVRCGGLMMENIRYRNLPAINKKNMALQTLKFVPNFQVDQHVSNSLQVFLQMVAENVNKDSISVVGITNDQMEGSVFEEMKKIGSSVYGVNISYEEFSLRDLATTKNSGSAIKKADLTIVRNLSTDDNMCQMLHFVLPRDSFIVSEEDNMFGGRVRPTSLFRQLSAHSNERTRLDLVRWRPSQEPVPTTAITVRAHLDFALLSSARANLSPRHRLLIVAPYPAPSALKQLVQSWRKDVQRNNILLVTVNNEEGNNFFLDDLPDIELAFSVFDHGKWGGEYYVPVQESAKVSSNVMLQSAQIGDLYSLEWVGAAETSDSGIPVKVHYTGLSNTDIKKAIGKITSSRFGGNNYGMDFSGTTQSGQRVMGLVRSGAASSVVHAQPELVWPVPEHWSLEDAATVPLAYAHAFYCLGIKSTSLYDSTLSPNFSVLVHGGAGALGQALLSILLAYGCEVYTTVSDMRKKRFLLKLFPQLKADHIGNSRDQSFVDMVLNARKGEGCNVVISSLKGDIKRSAPNCVGYLGAVFDVSQLHNQDEDFSYGLYHMTRERAYITIDFSSIFDHPKEMKDLQLMISEGITRGYVRPLSRVSYAPHDVARAFRLLAASRHRGRVLLKMDAQTTQAQPRISCNPNQSQLIVMNDENVGLQLVDKLVARGARKLHIHSKAHSSAKFQFKLRNWQKIGVQVQVSSQDLKKENDVVELLKEATKLGSIGGIYTVVNDGQMDQEILLVNLDIVSRQFCPDIRHFAVINVGETMLGKPTCLSRVQNKLPAKLVALPQQNNESSASDAVDMVEQALCGVNTLVVAQRTHRQQPDLLEKLLEIADICLIKKFPKTTTLEELGIQDDKLLLVASYLKIHYNIEFTEQEIPQLTLKTIMSLDKTENTTEDVKGLATFISYVDTDELLATSDLVCMPTIISGDVLREDEFDATLTYLCIMPGMEGHHERFRMLCERLKLPALVLQPGLDRPAETVRETAQRYVDVLLNKTGMKNTFYLLGYETGVFEALEMAAILEDLGLTGTVYCLGCAPNEVQTVIEENIAEYKTKDDLENAVIKHMFKLMVGDDVVDLEGALKGITAWPQKVDICVRTLLGRVPHSAQYSRSLIEAALARIERARSYVPPVRALRSQLVVLRAASTHVTPSALALQQYSQRPVAVHQLAGPLANTTNDISCSSLINEYLDPAMLDAFKEKNICESYLLNPYSFMIANEDV
ncbi:hypothetical protein PYW07_008649 [Mythimna separata]|uniref:Ketosynthase family 3 (KS3) domain-containing protein n=1 Tax=Mythimna separata TaxID=271217 RepID=A0AAD8DP83_MYTSE|nr:hypothetical protein PYW07_008649 [Mythimna separata]